MDYETSLKYLSGLTDRERHKRFNFPESLDHYYRFLEILGNPQKQLNGFLIGGTKGKGSTAHIIETICRKSGYSTGLYTSPHLLTYRERIRINGVMVSKDRFASVIGELSTVGAEISVFETLTAAAFLLFNRKNIDVPIFEVGLGGRLDATNVIEPDVSLMTSISLDHTDVLGSTLQDIAFEKSAIFRSSGKNISAPQREEVRDVFNKSAGDNIRYIEPPSDIEVKEDFTAFTLSSRRYSLGLTGRHQAVNAKLGLISCILKDMEIDYGKVMQGLKELKIPGRFQIIRRNPHIILDGAHNVDSMNKLISTLNEIYGKKIILVFSCMQDKDIRGMLESLSPITELIIPTENSSPRTLPADRISEYSNNAGMKKVKPHPESDRALEYAEDIAKPDDIIVITGSLYLIGDILKGRMNGYS